MKLYSRTGNQFSRYKSVAQSIAQALDGRSAILDGELLVLDADGKPQFRGLRRNGAEVYFYAFDLLQIDGQDLRDYSLIERKQRLRMVVPAKGSRLLYVDHLERTGIELYAEVCRQDLEGIVAKHRDSTYTCRGKISPWLKVKNPHYSQAEGREVFFQAKAAGQR